MNLLSAVCTAVGRRRNGVARRAPHRTRERGVGGGGRGARGRDDDVGVVQCDGDRGVRDRAAARRRDARRRRASRGGGSSGDTTGGCCCRRTHRARAGGPPQRARGGTRGDRAGGARDRGGAARGLAFDRVLTLGGAMIVSAGVGRMQLADRSSRASSSPRVRRCARLRARVGAIGAGRDARGVIAGRRARCSILLVRARHRSGDQSGQSRNTLATLADVVARRQYDGRAAVSALGAGVAAAGERLPVHRLAGGDVVGRGDHHVAGARGGDAGVDRAGLGGARAMRRTSRELADALIVLVACGTLGVAAYLNLKAGASLGWGILPDDDAARSSRARLLLRARLLGVGMLRGGRGGRTRTALATSRRGGTRGGGDSAPRQLAKRGSRARAGRVRRESVRTRSARVRVRSVPSSSSRATTTRYPIWYLQQVEGVRRDVLPVTVPLLPTSWYSAESRDGPVCAGTTAIRSRELAPCRIDAQR